MKKKLEKFLELEKKAGEWRIERIHDLWVEIRSGFGFNNTMIADCLSPQNAKLIIESRTIAPLAARKSLEAVEILEEQSKQLEDCKKALMAYGWGSEKAGSWMHDLQVLINKTKQFTEDFNND